MANVLMNMTVRKPNVLFSGNSDAEKLRLYGKTCPFKVGLCSGVVSGQDSMNNNKFVEKDLPAK